MTAPHRALILILVLALCLPLLAGCTRTASVEDTFFYMDTVISIRLYGDQEVAKAALENANTLLRELDQALSITGSDNDIAAIRNANANTPIPLRPDTTTLLSRALELSTLCSGAFTVTIAPLRALWQECSALHRLPTEEERIAALALVGDHHLSLQNQTLQKDLDAVSIDLGGIAKGYATDRLLSLFQENRSLSGGVISFGSSVAVFGQKPNQSAYRIGIRNPASPSAILKYITLKEGQALSVSGDYERFYTIENKQYGHILDPVTGLPPTNGLRSVAVITESAADADALSTALFVLGEQAARALYESRKIVFEAAFLYDDHHTVTPNFPFE